MTRSTDRPAPALRLLLAALLALSLGVAVLPPTGAHAGNSGSTSCLMGYNYADTSTGYLFALTEALDPLCSWVHVSIYNPGFLTSSGFGGARCLGTQLSHVQGSGYVTTSTTVSPSTFHTPCSNHYGAPAAGHRFNDWGALYFDVR